MQLRAGLYPRVSDDQDKTSRSVPQQVADLRAVCERENWRVVGEYPEPDRSASRFAKRDRPQWARLMADLRAGRFDVIVLWEPSRGDRRLTGWSEFLDECRDGGVLIHVSSHRRTYDLSNARDWKSLAEDGIDSAWESEKTSMRIRRDLADAAERGQPHGRLPYGYVRRYDELTRKLIAQEPHPEQAPIRREIVERVAGGDAISAIRRDLDKRGVPGPTGGRWAHSSIVSLVLNGEVAIGKRRHNGGPLLDGNWPSIVDEATHWRAVTVLSDPARRKDAERRGGIRPGGARWLLSYIARCAKCDAQIGARDRPVRGQSVPYYECRNGCAMIPAWFMDQCVIEIIVTFVAKPEMYAVVMRRDDSETVSALAEADAERGRLAAFEADAIAGRISSASFARIAPGIEARIAELETRTRRSGHPVLRGLLSRGEREADVRNVWGGMPLTARRDVVRLLTAEPGYLRLRPSGDAGRDHSAVLDPRRIELKPTVDTRDRP